MALKWGIASCGFISHDFVTALGTLSDNDHVVVAAAARDEEKAKKFAQLHGIPKAYGGGYECLAKDPEIEIVYIGVLNPDHYNVAMMMLENRKHVLCEKPLCMNEKQAQKLIKYAESKKLFLMEAIWSRFFPSYQYLKKQINAGNLGEITEVEASFGFNLADVDRMRLKALGGGTILDLGVYTIQVSQFAFREPPKSIKASGKLNEDGVDMEMKAELHYSTGVAKIQTSALGVLSNKAIIKGTKGQITLEPLWCPESLIDVDGKKKTWPLPEAKHNFNFMNSCGLRYEAEEARKCIRNGQIQSDDVSHNESLIIARIEDELRKQIGVVFPEDQ